MNPAIIEAAQRINDRATKVPGCTCTDDDRCEPCYRCPACDAAYFAAVARAVLAAAVDALPEDSEGYALDLWGNRKRAFMQKRRLRAALLGPPGDRDGAT